MSRAYRLNGRWHAPRVDELPADEVPASKAIDFLRRFHPSTPWALCSFGPNGEIGPARTFDPRRDGCGHGQATHATGGIGGRNAGRVGHGPGRAKAATRVR